MLDRSLLTSVALTLGLHDRRGRGDEPSLQQGQVVAGAAEVLEVERGGGPHGRDGGALTHATRLLCQVGRGEEEFLHERSHVEVKVIHGRFQRQHDLRHIALHVHINTLNLGPSAEYIKFRHIVEWST